MPVKSQSTHKIDEKDPVDFPSEIDRAHDPKTLGFKKGTTSTIPKQLKGEVWISGPVVMIATRAWNQLRNEMGFRD